MNDLSEKDHLLEESLLKQIQELKIQLLEKEQTDKLQDQSESELLKLQSEASELSRSIETLKATEQDLLLQLEENLDHPSQANASLLETPEEDCKGLQIEKMIEKVIEEKSKAEYVLINMIGKNDFFRYVKSKGSFIHKGPEDRKRFQEDLLDLILSFLGQKGFQFTR